MTRWMARLRRSAAALLGIHLLQATVLVASPACEPAATATIVSAAHSDAAPLTAHLEHHEHHVGSHVAPPDSGTLPSEDGSVPAPTRHPSGVACPMAMTCTVAAVVTTSPVLATRLVDVSTVPSAAALLVPPSLRFAPEPPPPRV